MPGDVDRSESGAEFAAVVWSEGLCRSFANRRQVAAYGRRLGKADPSRASKACPKPAIRGCGQR
jgi:hypothetical protein